MHSRISLQTRNLRRVTSLGGQAGSSATSQWVMRTVYLDLVVVCRSFVLRLKLAHGVRVLTRATSFNIELCLHAESSSARMPSRKLGICIAIVLSSTGASYCLRSVTSAGRRSAWSRQQHNTASGPGLWRSSGASGKCTMQKIWLSQPLTPLLLLVSRQPGH